jgi:hypothetical protein
MIDLRHDKNPLEMRRLVVIRPPANGCDMCPAAPETLGWIAPQSAESKAQGTYLRCEKLLMARSGKTGFRFSGKLLAQQKAGSGECIIPI